MAVEFLSWRTFQVRGQPPLWDNGYNPAWEFSLQPLEIHSSLMIPSFYINRCCLGEKGESTHRVVMEDISFHGAEKKQKWLQGRQGFLRVGLFDLVPQL